MHNLLVDRDTECVGKSPVAFERWYSTPCANVSFGQSIELKCRQAWTYRTYHNRQHLSDDATGDRHLLNFALRFQNDHRNQLSTYRLTDALGNGLDAASAINRHEQ